MKVTIIKFEGPYAICMGKDRNIIDIEKVKIPKEAKVNDMLNIEGSSIAMYNKPNKKQYYYIDDVILDDWMIDGWK